MRKRIRLLCSFLVADDRKPDYPVLEARHGRREKPPVKKTFCSMARLERKRALRCRSYPALARDKTARLPSGPSTINVRSDCKYRDRIARGSKQAVGAAFTSAGRTLPIMAQIASFLLFTLPAPATASRGKPKCALRRNAGWLPPRTSRRQWRQLRPSGRRPGMSCHVQGDVDSERGPHRAGRKLLPPRHREQRFGGSDKGLGENSRQQDRHQGGAA